MSERFETVAYVYSPSDLALLLSVFQSEDIPLVAIGRCHIAVNPALATALGGVELRVHAEDARDARLVLAGLDPIPCRGPLFTGSLPIDLLFLLLLMFLFAVAPPPRTMPCFVGVAAARRLA